MRLKQHTCLLWYIHAGRCTVRLTVQIYIRTHNDITSRAHQAIAVVRAMHTHSCSKLGFSYDCAGEPPLLTAIVLDRAASISLTLKSEAMVSKRDHVVLSAFWDNLPLWSLIQLTTGYNTICYLYEKRRSSGICVIEVWVLPRCDLWAASLATAFCSTSHVACVWWLLNW